MDATQEAIDHEQSAQWQQELTEAEQHWDDEE